MKRTLRYGMVGGGQNAFIGADHPGTVNWAPVINTAPRPSLFGGGDGENGAVSIGALPAELPQ